MSSVVLGYLYKGRQFQFALRLLLTLILDAMTILGTLQNFLS